MLVVQVKVDLLLVSVSFVPHAESCVIHNTIHNEILFILYLHLQNSTSNVESGEDVVYAAVQKVKEETGLNVTFDRIVCI